MQGLNLKRKKSKNVKFSQSGGVIEQILLSEQANGVLYVFGRFAVFGICPVND